MHLNKCSVKILCRRAFTLLSRRFLGQHSWDVWIFYPSVILKTLFVNIHSNFWENASLITNIFCHFFSTSSKEKILIGWQNYIFFHVAMKWKKPAGWKREKQEHFLAQSKVICVFITRGENVFWCDYVFNKNYAKSSRSVWACGDTNTSLGTIWMIRQFVRDWTMSQMLIFEPDLAFHWNKFMPASSPSSPSWHLFIRKLFLISWYFLSETFREDVQDP